MGDLVTLNSLLEANAGKPRSERLTARQFEMLEAMRAYFGSHGYPPTVRELADRLNVSSLNGVQELKAQLKRKGYIKDTGKAGSHRGYQLVTPGVPSLPDAQSETFLPALANLLEARGMTDEAGALADHIHWLASGGFDERTS